MRFSRGENEGVCIRRPPPTGGRSRCSSSSPPIIVPVLEFQRPLHGRSPVGPPLVRGEAAPVASPCINRFPPGRLHGAPGRARTCNSRFRRPNWGHLASTPSRWNCPKRQGLGHFMAYQFLPDFRKVVGNIWVNREIGPESGRSLVKPRCDPEVTQPWRKSTASQYAGDYAGS